MSDQIPQASIIIPVYRGRGIIAGCLEALLRQKTERSFEVIVVDDGSDDNTVEFVEDWIGAHLEEQTDSIRYQLISQSNKGPAAARNLGAQKARGEYLLFTDADCEPSPDWIDAMLAAFENPEICGAKGTYNTTQREWVARLVQVEYEEKYNRMKAFDSIDFIDTYAAAFRRDTFMALNGFDETFPTASVEDQEFSFRMAEAGHRMVFVPEATVTHRHAATLWGYMKKKFKIAYYKSYLLIRHPNRVKGDTHTPPSLIYQIPLTYGLLALILSVSVWSAVSIAIVLITLVDLWLMKGTFRVCRKQAPGLIPFVPLLLSARSLGLGAGLVSGMIRFRLKGKGKAGKGQP